MKSEKIMGAIIASVLKTLLSASIAYATGIGTGFLLLDATAHQLNSEFFCLLIALFLSIFVFSVMMSTIKIN